MPIYEYHCKNCDHVFEEMRPMAQYQEPCACPMCNHDAGRVVLSAPRLNDMKASIRQAHQVNERSAHEPRSTARHQCGPGCNHSSTPKTTTTKGGTHLKMQQGKRPWMIGH